jgi:autotransporter strand-loop-strand O-heptosyltransferase
MGISFRFVGAPCVVVSGENESASYRVTFADRDSNLKASATMKSGEWRAYNAKYFVRWQITVDGPGTHLVHNFDPTGKKIFVQIFGNALGDSIAAMPYIEEFARVHSAEVTVKAAFNSILAPAYPGLKFLDQDTSIQSLMEKPSCPFYAAYGIGGWLGNTGYLPNGVDCRNLPLQKIPAQILGVPFREIRPRVAKSDKPRPIRERYVAFSKFASIRLKHWHYPMGWQTVVDWLNARGLKAMSISKEPTQLRNVIKANGRPIEETLANIQHSEFYIGVSSGPAWLAWALGKPVVVISGATHKWCEFACTRIVNESVCHGCQSDDSLLFGNLFNFNGACPKGKDFICSKSITPATVIGAVAPLIKNGIGGNG